MIKKYITPKVRVIITESMILAGSLTDGENDLNTEGASGEDTLSKESSIWRWMGEEN